jgi:enoyl-CoA hydratase
VARDRGSHRQDRGRRQHCRHPHRQAGFCAGADLKEINSGNAAALATARGGFAGIVQRERTKPIIAAVDGPALAGGTEIVLSCDLVVASTTATFGIPEVKRSLVAAAGGLFRLGRKSVQHRHGTGATGDLSGGGGPPPRPVNRLVSPGEALDVATALAEQICPTAGGRARVPPGRARSHAPDEVGWKMSGRAWPRPCAATLR